MEEGRKLPGFVEKGNSDATLELQLSTALSRGPPACHYASSPLGTVWDFPIELCHTLCVLTANLYHNTYIMELQWSVYH